MEFSFVFSVIKKNSIWWPHFHKLFLWRIIAQRMTEKENILIQDAPTTTTTPLFNNSIYLVWLESCHATFRLYMCVGSCTPLWLQKHIDESIDVCYVFARIPTPSYRVSIDKLCIKYVDNQVNEISLHVNEVVHVKNIACGTEIHSHHTNQYRPKFSTNILWSRQNCCYAQSPPFLFSHHAFHPHNHSPERMLFPKHITLHRTFCVLHNFLTTRWQNIEFLFSV